MELSTAALVALLAAVVAVCIGTFTGAIGPHAPQLRPAIRPGTPRPSFPVQRRAELHLSARGPGTPRVAVTRYYAALDARRYRAAWRALAAPVRASFGGFAVWRAGFATTVSSRPTRIRARRSGGRAVVTLVLLAADRSPGGVVRRRFAVRWALAARGRRWVARAVSATRG